MQLFKCINNNSNFQERKEWSSDGNFLWQYQADCQKKEIKTIPRMFNFYALSPSNERF
jgi:hypothetical protein